MDDAEHELFVRAQLHIGGLPADEAEIGAYKAMLAPVRAAVDQLYTMDGVRYAEPAPVFAVTPDDQ